MVGYRYRRDGVTVVINSNTSLTDAKIRLNNHNFDKFRSKLTRPTGGEYRQTVHIGETVINNSNSNRQAEGRYSGQIVGRNLLSNYGLTVGHIFDNRNEICHINGEPFGVCRAIATHVIRRTKMTTADLAFLELRMDDTRNILDILQGGQIKEYKVHISKEAVKFKDVIIVGSDSKCKTGKIDDLFFMTKEGEEHNHLYNAIVITSTDGNSAITAKGDSGALVAYRPNAGENALEVVGIVLGVWVQNGQSMTIANHLWDVLNDAGQDEKIRESLFADDEVHHDNRDIDYAQP